jgi:hypothetical protein
VSGESDGVVESDGWKSMALDESDAAHAAHASLFTIWRLEARKDKECMCVLRSLPESP